jgi:hypothetical protein
MPFLRRIMSTASHHGRGGPKAIATLFGKVIEPVTAKRGFATANLLGAWPELVGPRFAQATQPERINWPRGRAKDDAAGTLIVKVTGGHAVYLQHELGTLKDRINSFLGFHAIGEIRLVQTPFTRPARKKPLPDPVIDASQAAALEEQIGSVEDEGLRAALRELGRAILGSDKKT